MQYFGGMQPKGKLYLLPVPIVADALHTLSPMVKEHIVQLRHYVVENTRTARRFLKTIEPSLVIDELQFIEIEKHKGVADMGLFERWLKEGIDVGLMSEAGCPGIADPGAEIVSVAQKLDVDVIPLIGPNSLLLALMASGLNGQSFSFVGYLPVKEPARSQQIKMLETSSKKDHQTQLFIETPYRNKQMFDELLKTLHGNTKLCIAQNITASNQFIKTKTIEQWKKHKLTFEKQPVVFLLLG
jgi:16S rRNA (cytidine1402-2'-O)-methyltransferase